MRIHQSSGSRRRGANWAKEISCMGTGGREISVGRREVQTQCCPMKCVPAVESLSCVRLFCSPMDCSPTRLLCPWDFPGTNTAAGRQSLLQAILLTQGLNRRLLHWQVESSPLTHQGSS